MMQRSIVAAPMPAAAFRGANRCFSPLCFVSLSFGEPTAAPRQMRLQEKIIILHNRTDATYQQKGTEGTDGVPMEGRLPKLAGRFLVVWYSSAWAGGPGALHMVRGYYLTVGG